MQFEWDDELLAAGHRAGLEALGRGEEAEAFTTAVRGRAPACAAAPGAAERVDYAAELRALLGDVGDDELDRFLDAEHEAWRPARALSAARTRCSRRCATAGSGSRSSPTLARAGAARPPRARGARRRRARRPRSSSRARSARASPRRDLRARARRARPRPARGAVRGRPPRRRRRGRGRDRHEHRPGAVVPGRREAPRSSRTSWPSRPPTCSPR